MTLRGVTLGIKTLKTIAEVAREIRIKAHVECWWKHKEASIREEGSTGSILWNPGTLTVGAMMILSRSTCSKRRHMPRHISRVMNKFQDSLAFWKSPCTSLHHYHTMHHFSRPFNSNCNNLGSSFSTVQQCPRILLYCPAHL